MSYKIDLSQLTRAGAVSLTQQVVDRFVAAIESGELEPGEKLPPTRELAELVGVNHLTAARVYRRLAELGYVTASVGRGTFVRALAPAGSAELGDDWQIYALPDRELSYSEQVLADAMSSAGQPDLISLAVGWPSPRLYPTEELARITADVFAEEGGEALSYLPAEGLYALREQLAERGRRYGFADDPDEIIVTSGAKQGISLVARAVLEPGDVAVVESPTFAGLLDSLRQTGARVIGVPVDEDGFDVGQLEQLLARHEVKLVALQTACQNPTGRDISEERRARLAELAIERNFFVLEDRVYADANFGRETVRPLRELAPAHVVYVNSLSKVVGGGLRAGWVAARGPIRERIATMKLESDFHSATLIQHIAARWLATGAYDRHLEETQPFYRERRDALLAALERHLPGEYQADAPQGGHHVWVTLSRPLDERALYTEAARHGVAFIPGDAITAERRTLTSMRLSFSLLDPPELDEGVKRLARAIREVRRRSRNAIAAPMS
ncbi:MAG: 2-aminoadipate transaminase [Thermoleophilaceae bacterium]|jgi:DNA-binding transcriptional MocR family regulator|nr:2-aminoadipate transaminase [Thermoleophilaceae bacterium]MEA2407895.1 2-aminoadipate transaminase [Thermoleophilaceae bacterium]